MGFLQGKRALITGIASERSIASGIAEAMHREGAQLAFTYQNEKLKSRVEKAAAEYGSNIVIPLDVTSDDQIAACFDRTGQALDRRLRHPHPRHRLSPRAKRSPASSSTA